MVWSFPYAAEDSAGTKNGFGKDCGKKVREKKEKLKPRTKKGINGKDKQWWWGLKLQDKGLEM